MYKLRNQLFNSTGIYIIVIILYYLLNGRYFLLFWNNLLLWLRYRSSNVLIIQGLICL